jgi:CBS domain-containing protein
VRCPFCGESNIPGVDLCEGCGADLAGLDLPEEARGFAGRLMTDRIGRIHLIPPLVVARESSVSEAVELMRRERHGCVLVEDGPKLVGIFTERDVLARVVRRGADPKTTPVGEAMTPDPRTLTPEDPPAFAIHRMVVGGLRHLPIVDGNRVAGFISVRNVLRYIASDVLAGP